MKYRESFTIFASKQQGLWSFADGFFPYFSSVVLKHTVTLEEMLLVYQQKFCCLTSAWPISAQGCMLKRLIQKAACLLASPSYSTMETRCMEVTKQ